MSPRTSIAAPSVFRALSDPTRLRILNLLRGGPLCVGDLTSALLIPQPAASRHLAYLRRAGLVEGERRDQWMFYALAPAASEFHARVLGCVGEALLREARRDEAALGALRRKGGCCPQHEPRRKSHVQ